MDIDVMGVFSERMTKARLLLGISKSELAERAGLSKQAISFYESKDPKHRRVPTILTAMKIAACLGVTTDWLCGISDYYGRAIDYMDYGMIARSLIAFDGFCRAESDFSDVDGTNSGINVGENECTLVTHDPVLVKFFKDWKQMKALLESKTISDDIYIDWLDANMRRLSGIQVFGDSVGGEGDAAQE